MDVDLVMGSSISGSGSTAGGKGVRAPGCVMSGTTSPLADQSFIHELLADFQQLGKPKDILSNFENFGS